MDIDLGISDLAELSNKPRLGHRLYLERVRPGVFREVIFGRRREEDEPGEIPEVALRIRDRNHDS